MAITNIGTTPQRSYLFMQREKEGASSRLMNDGTQSCVKGGRTGKGISDLGALLVEPFKDCLERGVAEPAADSSLFVVLISRT